jgi:hypothetical protein
MYAFQARRNRGFSLVEALVGVLFCAVFMVGAIELWRLAEYKSTKARIDARVTQILREASDFVAYVPYDLVPADGSQLRSGFLLQPLDPATGRYKNIYPFNVTVAVTTVNVGTPGESKQIVLTLTYKTRSDPQQQSQDNPQETIRTDALHRVKS